MMNLKKKALALAVAASALGVGTVYAHSLPSPTYVTETGLGQALIYPYLTAKGGWQSFLHVTNTSAYTVAAKVRFRAAKDSADVLDFIVILSPYDMWTGVVEQQKGVYGFRPTDNSCTAPNFGKDYFQKFIVQKAEVYAEVITMGVAKKGDITEYAKHSPSGMPADCSQVSTAFLQNDNSLLEAFKPSNNGLNLNTHDANVLTGKFDLVNVGSGWSGASRATVLADFGAPVCGSDTTRACTYTYDGRAISIPVGEMGFPLYANTNMWPQNGVGNVSKNWDHPTLAEGGGGLTAVNNALTKTSLINEWVLNPNLGELSSWIVTFPTKLLTVTAMDGFNAVAKEHSDSKLATSFGDASNCVPTGASIWNREEKALLGGVSPGEPISPLCNEANVINFSSGSIESSSVLNSDVAITIPTSFETGVLAGWMELTMPNDSISYAITPAWTTLDGWLNALFKYGVGDENAPNKAYVGRPVVGFNLTARATPSDTVLYDHAYKLPSGVER